jgi:hypothetical protein
LAEGHRRTKQYPEYELLDTGIFDQHGYFDVVVEYAKAGAEDLLIRITITNRGPEPALLRVLPTLWFRKTWSWGRDNRRPSMKRGAHRGDNIGTLVVTHWKLGDYVLYCAGAGELLFTENETNTDRLYGVPSSSPYVKDAFHSYVVDGRREAVNPEATGTKAAAHYERKLSTGQITVIDLRQAAKLDHRLPEAPFADFESNFRRRKEEADEFYNAVLPAELSADDKTGRPSGIRGPALV